MNRVGECSTTFPSMNKISCNGEGSHYWISGGKRSSTALIVCVPNFKQFREKECRKTLSCLLDRRLSLSPDRRCACGARWRTPTMQDMNKKQRLKIAGMEKQ